MILRSKFSFLGYVTIVGAIVFALVGLILITTTFKDYSKSIIEKLFSIVPILWAFFYMIWCEARNKIISLKIESNGITVKRFGVSRTYEWYYFDGYKTGVISSQTKTFEQIYLIKNGKRVVVISSFYFENYRELTFPIVNNINYLGSELNGLFKEFIESFK